MAREHSTTAAVLEPEQTAATDEGLQRLQGWIAALEADRKRLTRVEELRTARARLRDQRYLEFVREVLR
jgi:hypothetical protein